MRRVLMINYYYPPLGGIGSVRALKFARYLPEFGWKPAVVTPRNGFYYRDPSLDTTGISVHRTFSIEMSRGARQGLMARSAADLRPARPGGPLALLQRAARRHLYRPDAQVGWYPFALHAARCLGREERFAAVFSSSFPITAHLVACRLRSEFGLPWVAEFRDLWTSLAAYDSGRRRQLDERLEARLLAQADAVVTVSEGFAEVLRARGAPRVFVIPNGFDPEDYPVGEGTDDVIAYLGTYYPGRQDVDTLLQAIGVLHAQGDLAATRLRFIGEYGPELRASVRRFGLEAHFEATGFLPHRAALEGVARARLLLLAGLLDASQENPLVRGVIPAKTFDYLGARRPILYVGNVSGDVAALVRGAGVAAVVSTGDIEGAVAAIGRLLRAPRPTWSEQTMAYTRRALAGRLAEVLEDATSRRREA